MVGDNVSVAMSGPTVFPLLGLRIQLRLPFLVWTEWEAIFASFHFDMASFSTYMQLVANNHFEKFVFHRIYRLYKGFTRLTKKRGSLCHYVVCNYREVF